MKYYEYESRFNGVYSRDNLPKKIEDGAYVINLDGYSCIGTHWVALRVNINSVTYFDSFGVKDIPKEIKTFIKNKNVKANIFRTQAYDSICVHISVLYIWILWLKLRAWLSIQIFFHQMILRKIMYFEI